MLVMVIRLLMSLITAMMLAVSASAGEVVTYFHVDPVGSPLAASDAKGNILWKENYRPFGDRVQRASASASNNVWFAGKPQEAATGLSYFGARYYDPVLGRFMGVDPVDVNPRDVHSFSRYSYANNNPIKYVDPDGRLAETAWDVFNVGIGAASLISNINEGNYWSAALDGVGIVVDGAAAVAPFIPGGAGSIIKTERAVQKVAKTTSGRRVGDFTRAAKKAAKAESAAENGGKMACKDCGKPVENVASRKGEPTPENQAQVHHDPAIKDGGGRHSEAIVLCPPCHRTRHANED